MKETAKIKREFNEFAGKIAKLEALKHELDFLDTKGFEAEVGVIKAELKNVNAIPHIQRDLNSLKRKIQERDSREKVQARKEAGKGVHSELKRKIKSLENLVKKKRKVSVKKQLSDKEVEFVKDVPSLEKELMGLRKAFEKHVNSNKVKIDSGVGVIVDSRFDDFVSGIKGELTRKLKEKELLIDDKLKEKELLIDNKLKEKEMLANEKLRSDLETQRGLFSQKYKNLVDGYHEKYRRKVNDELKKEVSGKLVVELNKRLAEERNKLVASLLRANARRLEKERGKLSNSLQRNYGRKEQALRREMILTEKIKANSLKEIKKIKQHGVEKSGKQKVLAERVRARMLELRRALKDKINKLEISRGILSSEYERRKKLLGEQLERDRVRLNEYKNTLKRKFGADEKELGEAYRKVDLYKNELDSEFRKRQEHLKERLEKEKDKFGDYKKVLSRKFVEDEKNLIDSHRKFELSKMALSEHYRKKTKVFAAEYHKKEKVLRDEFDKKGKLLRGEFEKNKNELRRRIEDEGKESREKLAREKVNLKMKVHEELSKKFSALRKRGQDYVQNELRRRENQLRKKLDEEYKLKLKVEVERKEAELEKKKTQLEKNIVEHARKLFA